MIIQTHDMYSFIFCKQFLGFLSTRLSTIETELPVQHITNLRCVFMVIFSVYNRNLDPLKPLNTKNQDYFSPYLNTCKHVSQCVLTQKFLIQTSNLHFSLYYFMYYKVEMVVHSCDSYQIRLTWYCDLYLSSSCFR